MIRLNKFMANAGLCSRRKADEWIQEGRVRVNGEIVTNLGTKIDPENDRVEVDGKPVVLSRKEFFILFHKPQNCLTTVSDPFHRKTVLDYVRVPYRIYPVGRLDYDTEGLLLLTNSGELAYRLTHPKFEIDKVYRVTLKKAITPEMMHSLEKGVEIAPGSVVSGKVETRSSHIIELTIHQGEKRQVKRMLQAVDNSVTALKRIRLGFLELGSLQPGEWRFLNVEEISQLKKTVGLPWK